MNATTKSFLSLFMISAMLLGGYSFLSVRAQNSEGLLGKDIATTFRGILKGHQSVIENFMLETKLTVASTQEERLNVIDYYINETLRAEINRVKQERENLIAKFEADEIDSETLAIELKDQASDIAAVAKTMGTIGEELSQLGQGLEENLKPRAEELSNDLQALEEEATSVANAVLGALSSADIPVAHEVIGALIEVTDFSVQQAAEEVPEEIPQLTELPEEAKLPEGMPELPQEVPPQGTP